MFNCDRCPRFFFHNTLIIKHVVLHLPKESRRNHPCRMCGFVFMEEGVLRRHIKEMHETVDKSFHCNFCDKSFKTKTYLNGHFARRHEERPFLCQQCPSTFIYELELQKHIDELHCTQNNPGFFCEACGKKFFKMTSFNQHRKIIHEEKTFKCSHAGCDKRYESLKKFEYHQKIHLNQKDFKCTHEGCVKSYFQRRGLQKHIILSHQNLRKNCPVTGCKYKAGRIAYMRTHLTAKHKDFNEE